MKRENWVNIILCILGILVLVGLLMFFGTACNNTQNNVKPEPTIIAPTPISQVTINVEGYAFWGDYASLYNLFAKIWTRLTLLIILILGLTEYLKLKVTVIPKLWVSFASGFIFLVGKSVIFGVMKWLGFEVDFQIGETLFDMIISTLVANWVYMAIGKKIKSKFVKV